LLFNAIYHTLIPNPLLLSSLYLSPRLFVGIFLAATLLFIAYFFPLCLIIAKIAIAALLIALFIDALLLYRWQGLSATRLLPDRLSNGDDNPISIHIDNGYPYAVSVELIDELPPQFQRRDTLFKVNLPANEAQTIGYTLRPTERGLYQYGVLNAFAATPLGLLQRRYQFEKTGKDIPVYPSFLQMRQYELIAISSRLQEYGIKRIRRIGQSMEFEHIREYVSGDDYRNVNWKASARNNEIMVNQYQDEKSQPIVSLIDKGRVMRMPFEGLSLLDYAINAALAISNIAIKKGDKAGLLTFAHQIGSVLAPSKQGNQMQHIQETLYNEQTQFLETDYQKLFVTVRRQFNQRCLLLLYTNFESLTALQRQLPYMRRLAKGHLLVVIFFENTELFQLTQTPADTIEAVYQKTIAEKLLAEKRQIVKELQAVGIQSILTTPQHLTVNTINKYLELKARGMI
jgi:uncharacterized protein (DUF58 family)